MKYTIATKGLMCGHCDAKVETALDAEADHETNTVEVECSEDVTPEQLKAAVLGASDTYQVLGIEAA